MSKTTLWGDRKVGDRAQVSELPEGYAVVIAEPDWIAFPPEIQQITGRKKGRVLESGPVDKPCPVCKESHGINKAYVVDGGLREGHHLIVCECGGCKQYVWMRYCEKD